MVPFARSIAAKFEALNTLEKLTPIQKRVLLGSINDDIKSAAQFHKHAVSARAMASANEIGVDLSTKTAIDQRTFDQGRKRFVADLLVPLRDLRRKCQGRKENAIADVLANELKVAWLTREEFAAVRQHTVKGKRSEDAYKEARIELKG